MLNLKINKIVKIFLADDNNIIFYFNSIFLFIDGKKLSSNDNLSQEKIQSCYNDFISGVNNIYQPSQKQNKILTSLNIKKSKHWKKYKNGRYLSISKYTPSTMTFEATNDLTYTYNNSLYLTFSSYYGNGYLGLVYFSGSTNINFSYIPDVNINLLMVGGGSMSTSSQAGGGGGYIYINDNSFTTFLQDNLNTDLQLIVGSGGYYESYNENTNTGGGYGIDSFFGVNAVVNNVPSLEYYSAGGGAFNSIPGNSNGGTSYFGDTQFSTNGGGGEILNGSSTQPSTLPSLTLPFIITPPNLVGGSDIVYIGGGGTLPNTNSLGVAGRGSAGYTTILSPSNTYMASGNYNVTNSSGPNITNAYGSSAGAYITTDSNNNTYFTSGSGGNGIIIIWYPSS